MIETTSEVRQVKKEVSYVVCDVCGAEDLDRGDTLSGTDFMPEDWTVVDEKNGKRFHLCPKHDLAEILEQA